jgi:hypothetical protein
LSLKGKRVGLYLALFLAYAALTLLMTLPLALQLNSHLIGDGDDMWVHYWNGWWAKRVLQRGGSVYHTPLLFHPRGVSLVTHNFAWFNIGLWLVLEPLLGGVAAYNVAHLIHVPLSGLAMFGLMHDRTRATGPAFVAGLVYAFWPYRMLDVNHPNMIATEGFPLLLLLLHRLFTRDRPLRYGALVGLTTALIGYMRLQHLILGAALGVLYLLYVTVWWREAWRGRALLGLALAGVLALGLMAPILTPLVREQLAGDAPAAVLQVRVEDVKQDLLAWVVPQHQHPLSRLYARWIPAYTYTWRYSAYVGIGALLLSGVALVRRRRRRTVRLWALFALLTFLLALGPYLQVAGRTYPHLKLPYALIGWLAPVRMLRYPHRFNALLALPVAALVGHGAGALRRWLVRAPRWRPLFYAVVSGLLLLDYLSAPAATVAARVPDFYATLAGEAGDFALAELPGARGHSEYYMFYQTHHGRPILAGHVSRLPPDALDFINAVPLLAGSYREGGLNLEVRDVSRQLARLSEAGFRYLILHKRLAPDGQLAAWRAYLPMPPHHEDDALVVYKTAPVVGEDVPLVHTWDGVGLVGGLLPGAWEPGEPLTVHVTWAATAPPGRDLEARVTLRDVQGAAALERCRPVSAVWPPSAWPADAVAHDALTVEAGDWAPEPGATYTVTLDLGCGPGDDPAGPPATLGTVRVTP